MPWLDSDLSFLRRVVLVLRLISSVRSQCSIAECPRFPPDPPSVGPLLWATRLDALPGTRYLKLFTVGPTLVFAYAIIHRMLLRLFSNENMRGGRVTKV